MTIIRTQELLDRFKIGRSTLWRWQRERGFPRPLAPGDKVRLYILEEVEEWLASRKRGGAVPAEQPVDVPARS